ncbi:MAG: DsrE family protein [Dechloromonas sp.]|nr:DsrE family protein [Dechloromonas sp.]
MPTDAPTGLALLIASATPDRPDLCVTPLVHALAARALDYEVEIHFSGPAVRWLVEGIASSAYPTAEREKSIQRFLDELAREGVKLYACSMAGAAWVGPGEPFIAQCAGHAGATAFVARTLDPAWRTLVF